MFVFIRAVTYATLFIGFFLVYLPSRFSSWFGVERPATIGIQELAGMVVVAAGSLIALWCILTFVLVGRGTPAPFDPPRRLVTGGPYRFVRNPMYVGAGITLAGVAVFYHSWLLLCYGAVFLLVTHALVLWYEEPALGRTFGDEYEAYCRRTRRWLPMLRKGKS